MQTLKKICEFLDQFAPHDLAEPWDNTGLLVGDEERQVSKLMTCLTVTPETVIEAVEQNANLIVTHHPMMFRPIKKITADSISGKMLLELIQNEIAVYSPHTAFDSTANGINELIAETICLLDVRPLKPTDPCVPDRGAGRIGMLDEATNIEAFAESLKRSFNVESLGVIGKNASQIQSIAIACGSGGSFLADAIKEGADAFVTGETTFHTSLEAKAEGVAMFLLGHYASERFAVELLAQRLQSEFGNVEIWPSSKESDPIRFV